MTAVTATQLRLEAPTLPKVLTIRRIHPRDPRAIRYTRYISTKMGRFRPNGVRNIRDV